MLNGAKWSLIARSLSALVVASTAGFVVIADCFSIVGSATCCTTYWVGCPKNQNLWSCEQSKTAGNGPFTVNVLVEGGAGRTETYSNTVGACTMVYRSCGPTPGACIASAPASVTCVNTNLAGPDCDGGGGGGR